MQINHLCFHLYELRSEGAGNAEGSEEEKMKKEWIKEFEVKRKGWKTERKAEREKEVVKVAKGWQKYMVMPHISLKTGTITPSY